MSTSLTLSRCLGSRSRFVTECCYFTIFNSERQRFSINNSSVLKPNVLHLPRVTLFPCFSLLPFFFFIEELYCSCHTFSLFLPSPCQVLIQLSIFIRVRLLMLFERNGPIMLLTTSVLHVFYVSLAGISGTKSVFGLSSSFHL